MLTKDNAFLLKRRQTAWEYLAKATFTNGPVCKIEPIMRFIEPGSTVIDIGASMGFFSRRFARKAGLDEAKKMKADNILTEDTLKNYEKDVQDLTNKHTKRIEELATAKENDLMKI